MRRPKIDPRTLARAIASTKGERAYKTYLDKINSNKTVRWAKREMPYWQFAMLNHAVYSNYQRLLGKSAH